MGPTQHHLHSKTTCAARSSTDSIGLSKVSTVKKAAKLAVYEAIIMRAKKNHNPANNLVESEMGATSEPCCMSEPMVNL